MGKFTFTKEERLNKEKWIKALFEKGSSLKIYPFRVIHLDHPDQHHPFHQVLISVSAKTFKRAVDRNLLKRRIREAYRVHKTLLPAERKLLLGCIYTAREIDNVDKINKGLVKAFESIAREYGRQRGVA